MSTSRKVREQQRTNRWILGITAAVLAIVAAGIGYLSTPVSNLPLVTVYKSSDCRCCRAWIRHLEQHGFRVQVGSEAQWASVRERHGVPLSLQGCHTAIVNGLLIEGHVPADDIHRGLAEHEANPDRLLGLLLPGMPLGSPGMESAHRQPYTVLAWEQSGVTRSFANHKP